MKASYSRIVTAEPVSTIFGRACGFLGVVMLAFAIHALVCAGGLAFASLNPAL